MSGALPPSGQQYEIRHGPQRAVIVEVGGGLRVYETDGTPVLDGYEVGEQASGGRGQPLIPWPNRLRDGCYEFDGTEHQLPLNELSTQTAIHGLVRWANWTAVEQDSTRVTMSYRLHPQPGWPGLLELTIEYGLDDDGLTVTTTAENAGAADCPFGAGFHPYISLGVGQVDEMTVRAPGQRYLEADDRGLPVASHDVQDTKFDYREPRQLGAAQIDTCFTDLARDPGGRAQVEVRAAESKATLWMDEAFGYLMLFTGDTLGADRRRRGLAVEPMTCPPDALRTGQDVVRLAPGVRFQGRWGISAHS